MNAISSNAALRGMLYQMDRLETVADNLANSSAPGYKKTVSSQSAFDAMVKTAASPGHPHAGYSQAAQRSVDFSPGPLRSTDNPLDFAINGDGFFVVAQNERTYYTRNGRFQLNPDGQLVTSGGYVVQGRNGPLTLPPDADLSQLTVDADGTLRSDERELGAIRLAGFADPSVLNRVGPTLFSAPIDVEPEIPQNSRATNRAVEGANTSVYEEMAELIGTTRAFEISQRMLKQLDQSTGETIRKLST
jgi:flagellar basal-body rod protein FlgF